MASSTIFLVFGKARPGIEPRTPILLANALLNNRCLNFCDEAWWFLSLRVFGLLSSSFFRTIYLHLSLHNTSNRNGQHLTDFMIENRLACLNTNYQKREGKLWTYTYANNTKTQIDYVLINKKWKNSAMNCEAYSSFEGVSTDHRIVMAKIRLSLRKNTKRTVTTKHYDWAFLNNRDIRDKYVLELRNRYETLQERTEKSTPNDEYENFRQCAPRGSSEVHSNKTQN